MDEASLLERLISEISAILIHAPRLTRKLKGLWSRYAFSWASIGVTCSKFPRAFRRPMLTPCKGFRIHNQGGPDAAERRGEIA